MRSRLPISAAGATATALALTSGASAHVELDPPRVPAGSSARIVIQVAKEEPKASTAKVAVKLPAHLVFVSFDPKPGWRRTITLEKLKTPLRVREHSRSSSWSVAVASAIMGALVLGIADPTIGVLITLLILLITWDSWQTIYGRAQ